MIGGRLVSVTAPLGSAGSDGPCSFLYRRSGPGIGLCFAKQVPERQPKKKVNLAISNGLIEHPERPPDSHSCSSRKWQRIRCGFHEPELLNFDGTCRILTEKDLQNLSFNAAVFSPA
jgi:hypothetical protein